MRKTSHRFKKTTKKWQKTGFPGMKKRAIRQKIGLKKKYQKAMDSTSS
jgi:hypothetical protein